MTSYRPDATSYSDVATHANHICTGLLCHNSLCARRFVRHGRIILYKLPFITSWIYVCNKLRSLSPFHGPRSWWSGIIHELLLKSWYVCLCVAGNLSKDCKMRFGFFETIYGSFPDKGTTFLAGIINFAKNSEYCSI